MSTSWCGSRWGGPSLCNADPDFPVDSPLLGLEGAVQPITTVAFYLVSWHRLIDRALQVPALKSLGSLGRRKVGC